MSRVSVTPDVALVVSRLVRRSILIYVATVVVPIGALLWLGLQSFERQRQSVQKLTEEKISATIQREARDAAAAALADRRAATAKMYFAVERGAVVEPRLQSPLPRMLPPEFLEAQQLEIVQKRPELALPKYRRLASQGNHESLALHFVGRSLSALGRAAEAEAVWLDLMKRFPDDCDLAGRPYGIVAAINARHTTGLADQILAGRWTLSADQAEHFLKALESTQSAEYLEHFQIGRELQERFRPPAVLREGEIHTANLGLHRLFYRQETGDRIAGLVADPAWLSALEHRVRTELMSEGSDRQSLLFFTGAVAVLLLVMSAGIVIVHRDLSRESREQQRRADFVNGVTHELKTPVTIMRLYGETLLNRRQLSEAEQRDFYRVISRESARLGRLVDQVLRFSRVDSGDAQYDLQECDPAPVIGGVIDDYTGWLEHAGFQVTRDLAESLPPVRLDSSAVSQAVVNLLDNAVKYSGNSKEIVVRLAFENRQVIFEVIDRGIGVAGSEQRRIFDRFYRAANRSGRGGYGLGLYMVRHIMEAHGGRVDVESVPGQGSTFRLTFPVAAS